MGESGARAIIDHVECLVTDTAYAADCSAAARQLAERRYSVDRMIAAYTDLYASLRDSGEPSTGALPGTRLPPGAHPERTAPSVDGSTR
jgi:hypothetical protein